MTTDDSMSDDVFEEPEVQTKRTSRKGKHNDYNEYYFQPTKALQIEETEHRTPSPSGYPGYRPPKEALQMYALNAEDYYSEGGDDNSNMPEYNQDNVAEGWKSYKIDEDNEAYDVVHKTILLGDSGVGKTSLLVKYTTGDFKAGSFSATVGIALTNKIVTVDHTRVKLQIWDTAGQERFRSVTHAYYRDAHALLLLYDVTNKVSFDNIRAWLVEIREYAQDDVVIMLLGNKADCGYERQVRKEDGERLSREYNVAFMETSAKTGLNVELAFAAVARQLKSRRNESIDDAKFNVQDFVKEQTHKPTCPPCNM